MDSVEALGNSCIAVRKGDLGRGKEDENLAPVYDVMPSAMAAVEANNNINPIVYKSFGVRIENIPKELKLRKQWVVWCYETIIIDTEEDAKRKPGKIPIKPLTEINTSVSDPSTWGTFEEALEDLVKNVGNYPRRDGLGYVFTRDDPYQGTDLDDCIDPRKGTIDSQALDIIHTINSYTERSKSKKGFHIITKAKLPSEGRRKGKTEMYDSGRFFAFTGDVFEENGKLYNTIEERQDEVEKLHLKVFGSRKSTGGILDVSLTLADEDLIELAENAKDGEKFKSLFYGDTSGYTSQSEADLALCNILAFWTQDRSQIDRIFRISGLMRSKWDERHGHGTYGEITIQKALDEVKEHYQGKQRQNAQIKPMDAVIESIEYLINKDTEARLVYTSLDEPYLWINARDHFEMIKLNPKNKYFKMFLFGQVKERYGITLKDDETFKNALLAIEYTTKNITEKKGFDLYPPELGYRCTWHNNSAWIDLCGPDWKGIKINENGFVKSDLPAIFLRKSTQKELVEPNFKATLGDFDKIFKYINVRRKSHKLLIKVWICAAMVPRLKNKAIAQPWLSFTGLPGVGKTKAAQYAKKLVDPVKGDENGSDKAPLPKDEKDLAVVLNNSQVIIFDNAGKKIGDDLSNILCISVVRGCYATRKLYSDDELASLNLSSAIIITSVAIDSLNEDLLSRMIPIELEGFDKDNKRKPEVTMEEAFYKDLPDILGGAYNSISKALGRIDQAYKEVSELEETPRVMDFTVIGEALSREWGEEKGSFIKAYQEAQGKKSAENITSSPVITTLIEYIKSLEKGITYDGKDKKFKNGKPFTFYGPISKLLTALKEYYNKENGSYPNERAWPQTDRALGNKIKGSMMGLKNSGIMVKIDPTQTYGSNYYTIKVADKTEVSADEAW